MGSMMWLAVKDMLLMARDWKALLTLIFMPLLLIGILGASFGNVFTETSKIQPFTVGVANQDQGEFGDAMIEDVFKGGLESLDIKVEEMSLEDLKEKMEGQEYPVGLVIPEDFSAKVIEGDAGEIDIFSPSNESIPAMVVENVVHQFVAGAGVQLEGYKLLAETAAGQEIPAGGTEKWAEQPSPFIVEAAMDEKRSTVDSFQYYAAGMGVMFLLITVVIFIEMMLEEKEQDVYKRLLVSRLSFKSYLGGKLLGLLIITSIQFMMMVLGTSWLFGVEWGDSFAGVLAVGFAFVFSASSLGLLASSFVKTKKSFSAAGMLGTQLLAVAGGSMVPLYLFPDWLNTIMTVFPNALALQSFLELMAGSSLKEQFWPIIQLAALGCLFLLAAWTRMQLERRRDYA